MPEHVIRTTALAVTTEVGAVGPDDLYEAVATWLGFKRLGARIKTRIAESVSSLVDGVAVQAADEQPALRVECHADLDLKR